MLCGSTMCITNVAKLVEVDMNSLYLSRSKFQVELFILIVYYLLELGTTML